MDSDLDPFGDILPEPPLGYARAGGKFQPKAKPRPRMLTSASVADNVKDISDAAVNKALVDSHTTPFVDVVNETVIESDEPTKDLKELHSKDDQAEVKVNEMGLDLDLDIDPFGDILPPPSFANVRAGGKFQPRGKARPGKGISKTVASAVFSSTMEEHASLPSTKSVDVEGGRLTDPVNSSLSTLVRKESLRNDDYRNSGVLLSSDDKSSGLVDSSQLLSTDAVNLGVVVMDPCSGLGKAMGESTNIFSGLEYIHDLVTQSPTGTEIPVLASNEETEGQSTFTAQNSVDSSAHRGCNVVVPDPVSCNEEAIQNNNGRPELDEIRAFSNLERPDNLSETIITSECYTRIQPKSNVQTGKEKFTGSNLPPDAVDSVVSPSNAGFDRSETMHINEGSIPTFPSDDVLGCSSMSFGNFIPPLPLNEEQINLAEASRSSEPNVLSQEDLSGETAKSSKSRERKSYSVSNPSEKFSESSVVGEMGEGGKFSRQLRKRTTAPQLVDEPEDEACDNDCFPSKASSKSIADEEDNDYDYRVDEDNNEDRVDEDSDNEDRLENTSCNKRASEKMKKPANDKGKTVRRRKRDNDASEQVTQKPRKKFSHSTRRKNRLKDLLSMPEDEIDYQQLPVRDIILLAGYKENLTIKEAKASKNASTNESNANSFRGEDSHNEEDTFTSEQDGGHTYDLSNQLFNSHSFMDKKPTSRWSKQDTELFYEGIQQFGTDLSMIQQLFPGRTRHQIKLKYKKEERQQPLRLSEALHNRAKGHSHFEKVIEQLQQVAAQAEQESNRDATVGVTDEEAELNPETNGGTLKSERDENATADDQEVAVDEVHSPSKLDEDDDDVDIWNSYNSVF